MLKILAGLIVFVLCLMAARNEYYGRKNLKVCAAEILFGALLVWAVMS